MALTSDRRSGFCIVFCFTSRESFCLNQFRSSSNIVKFSFSYRLILLIKRFLSYIILSNYDPFCSVEINTATFRTLAFTFLWSCIVAKNTFAKERYFSDNLIISNEEIFYFLAFLTLPSILVDSYSARVNFNRKHITIKSFAKYTRDKVRQWSNITA